MMLILNFNFKELLDATALNYKPAWFVDVHGVDDYESLKFKNSRRFNWGHR